MNARIGENHLPQTWENRTPGEKIPAVRFATLRDRDGQEYTVYLVDELSYATIDELLDYIRVQMENR